MQNKKKVFVFGKEKEVLLNRFSYIFLWIYAINVQIFLKVMSYICQINDVKGKKKWDTKYFKLYA